MTPNRITSLLSIPCYRIVDGRTQYGLLDCQESKLRFHKRETGEESIPIYKIESADINEEGGVLTLTFLSRFGLLTFYCDSNISKERATRLVHAIQGEIEQHRKASYRTTPFYKVETQAQVDDWKPDTCKVEVYKQEMFIHTPDREYRIPATSIKELQWRSIFRSLVLYWQTEEGTLRALFYGLVARKLHAYLRALQDGSIRGHWTGSLRSTLQWDVLLVSSSKSLYITTLSPISILFSSLTQRIPFETISMAKYGIRGLHLQSLAGHHYHFIPHKSPLFNARRICQHFARFGRTYAKESVSTAYRWLPTREIHRGILHIEEKQLRFSYHQRDREDDCWNYQQLSRDDDGDSNKEFLSLRAGVESIRIQPSKGVSFLEYFHEKTKLPHHRLYWQELSTSAKKRIVHNAVAHIHSNRLNQNLMAKLLFVSGKIVVQPLSSSKVTQFTDVSVEFNTPTGRYTFQSYISPT
ncbi:MAG: hypothetical protein VX278_09520, partial [Myxococcota bacterium]|nr:hypothetical protein [Myxococcota bacterium]